MSKDYLSLFKKLISTVRSRGINCQVIIQSAAQLADRYEKKEWEEIIGNADTQLFLGCNDTMTADYISGKCGFVTIKTTNDSMPLMPLFSPVLNSTKPYSQTKSNTQRALMLPDEVLRMPNDQSIILLRGQKPLMLYKIIPDELPAFKKLSPVRITDYLPEWKRKEDEAKSKSGRRIEPETKHMADPPRETAAKEERKETEIKDLKAEVDKHIDAARAVPEKSEYKPGGSAKYGFVHKESTDITTDKKESATPIEKLIETFETDEEVPCVIMEKTSPSEITGRK